MSQLFEKFAALSALPGVVHAFTRRVPGIDVLADKPEVLRRLDAAHRAIRNEIGAGDWPLLTAEQIHGDKIAVVEVAPESDREFAGCDGFITKQRKTLLGIHVADCGAVYLVDPKTPAIGLVHSGKKGTEKAIAAKAIHLMQEKLGSNPAEMIVQLSPCIRPPNYEIDFARDIIQQCRDAGVQHVHDSGVCTACHPDLYYSYRLEKGKTGRLLALLGLA